MRHNLQSKFFCKIIFWLINKIKNTWKLCIWFFGQFVDSIINFSEELAQRLQGEENRAAHQAQEQNERARANQNLLSQAHQEQQAGASSSRQVERHESQRNKNVSYK